MNEDKSSGCGHCGHSSILPIKTDKWGRCVFCVALALAGTVTGWSFTLSFWLLYPAPRITMVLACISLCFTVVLLLHVIAYALRSPETRLSFSVFRRRPTTLRRSR
jgi:hypothetical protein